VQPTDLLGKDHESGKLISSDTQFGHSMHYSPLSTSLSFLLFTLQLGLTDSPYYVVNGVSLAVTYFIFRVLNQPLVVLAYVAQYHQWDFLRAAASLRLVCYFTLVTQYSFQVYWFSAILRLVVKGLKEKYLKNEGKTKTR